MYKQIIIARKDLNMSPGKLAGQVSHASMAFLTNQIKENGKRVCNEQPYWSYELKYDPETKSTKKEVVPYARNDLYQWTKEAFERDELFFYVKPINPDEPHGKLELCDPTYSYRSELIFNAGIYEEWINGIFTKVVLEAKNKNQLLKAKTMAEEIGMKEDKDFFLIKDCCATELEPEEIDENGIGRTLTCIGFKPMDSEIIDKIGKKYQLYK